jgi:hypothetical protein
VKLDDSQELGVGQWMP